MPANKKYIPAEAEEYRRVRRAVLDFEQADEINGSFVEVTAVLKKGGRPVEIADRARVSLPFRVPSADFTAERTIVNPATDTDGQAAYQPAVLRAWGKLLEAGKYTPALLQVLLQSEFRQAQRARDAAEVAPPEQPAP